MSDFNVYDDVERDARADAADEREVARAEAHADALADLEPEERRQVKRVRSERSRERGTTKRRGHAAAPMHRGDFAGGADEELF